MAIGNPITLTSNVASKTINVIATASQSLFTVTGGYRINEIAVFRNGVRLVDGRDFTARDGTTVTLLSAATEGDAVEFQIFDTFRVADAITPFDSDQTIAGNLNITGILSASQLGSVNFNVTSGIQTFNDVRVGGALTVAGVLTFDDVTNVDSVGYATFRSGINVQGAGSTTTTLNVTGVSTFTGNIDANGALDVDGHTELDDVNVSGASTFAGAADFNGALDVNGEVTVSPNTAGKNTITLTTNASNDGRVLVKSDTTTKVDLQANGTSFFDGGSVEFRSADAVGIADSIFHIGDTNTKIRFPAADTFTVETGGSERIRVDSNGALLVAKTTTSLTTQGSRVDNGLITVSGDSSSTNLATNSGGVLNLANADSTDNNFSNIGGYNSNGLVVSQIDFINTSHSSRTGDIAFLTHNGSAMSERLRITSAGSLQVKGDANPNAVFDRGSANTTNVNFNFNGTLTGQLGAADAEFQISAVGASTPLSVFTNGSERLRITSAGKIGVGENSPDRLLHLKAASSTAYSGGSDTADYNLLKIENTTDDKSAGVFFLIGSNGEAAITATEVADGNTDICFQNRGGGVRSEKLRITSGGDVGIGTDNPQQFVHIHDAGNSGIVTTRIQQVSSNTPTDGGAFLQLGGTRSTGNFGHYGGIFGGRRNNASDNSGYLAFHVDNNDGESMSERVRITHQGRIGIGTDDPQGFLVIQGDSNDSSLPSIRLQDGTDARQVHITNTSGDFLVKTCGSDDSTHGSIKIFESGIITLNNGGASGSNTERVRIDTAGRLLRGSTSFSAGAAAVFAGNSSVADGNGVIFINRGHSNAMSGGDGIGNIEFGNSTGNVFARISAEAGTTSGVAGSNDYPGTIRFWTTPDGSGSASERMRINHAGSVGINEASPSATLDINNGARTHTFLELSGSNNTALGFFLTHSSNSYTGDGMKMHHNTGATSAMNFMAFDSGHGGTPDREFTLRGDGNAYADGTWNNNGADYAEYFESSTGAAIPVGTTVVLENNKVRAATSEDSASSIMGVVRPKEPGQASMTIGNTAWNKWTGKYLTDDFDRFILDEHVVYEWTETGEDGQEINHSYQSHAIPEGVTVPDDVVGQTHDAKGNRLVHYRLNPDFDPSVTYVPREERDEWIIVGLIGQVKILDGQPMNDRWVKMRDVSDSVEEWFIR